MGGEFSQEAARGYRVKGFRFRDGGGKRVSENAATSRKPDNSQHS